MPFKMKAVNQYWFENVSLCQIININETVLFIVPINVRFGTKTVAMVLLFLINIMANGGCIWS